MVKVKKGLGIIRGPKGEKGDKGDTGNVLAESLWYDSKDNLPITGDSTKLYLVPDSTEDYANMYIWNSVKSKYMHVGTTQTTNLDLSNYYNRTEVDEKLGVLSTMITN